MKRYAFIHGLYGEDFVQEAILSIASQVDRVLFFWADTPWYGVTRVQSPGPGRAGPTLEVPTPIDNMLFKAMQLNLSNVDFIKFSPNESVFRMMYAANKFIPRDAEVLIHTNGVDVVQYEDGIEKAVRELATSPYSTGVMSQRWVWKQLDHEAIMHGKPSGSIINLMSRVGWSDAGMLAAFDEHNVRDGMFSQRSVPRLESVCWNVGFAFNYYTMKWRDLLRRAQCAAGLRYQCEGENWVDEVWAPWKPGSPARAGQLSQDVVTVLPFDTRELPQVLQARVV